jgi:hypothetical protein
LHQLLQSWAHHFCPMSLGICFGLSCTICWFAHVAFAGLWC